MTVIRSYTTIEQSKVLAKILPLESADMSWVSNGLGKPFARTIPIKGDPEELCACWSLAALLSILPNSIYDNTDEYSQLEFTKRSVAYHDMNDGIKVGSIKDNLVDAAYEVVLKLYKLDLL